MTERSLQLLELLADGKFHSGESLGQRLGITRAAVSKSLRKLRELGIDYYAVTGKGYRLSRPYDPLTRAGILAELLPGQSVQLELLHTVDSTNTHLMQAATNGANSGHVVMAEQQRAGRGRRGRQWISPYGSNIYLSILWRFDHATPQLAGLSLAVATALMQTLEALGVEGAGIKWPNDILLNERKLAGILVDVAGESSGPCHAVIGIGINHSMPDAPASDIGQPWIDLTRAGIAVSRDRVAGMLLRELYTMLDAYAAEGFETFIDSWRRWDLTVDQEVIILQGDARHTGIARGIDRQGFLLVEREGVIKRYAAGEVSLRRSVA